MLYLLETPNTGNIIDFICWLYTYIDMKMKIRIYMHRKSYSSSRAKTNSCVMYHCIICRYGELFG